MKWTWRYWGLKVRPSRTVCGVFLVALRCADSFNSRRRAENVLCVWAMYPLILHIKQAKRQISSLFFKPHELFAFSSYNKTTSTPSRHPISSIWFMKRPTIFKSEANFRMNPKKLLFPLHSPIKSKFKLRSLNACLLVCPITLAEDSVI